MATLSIALEFDARSVYYLNLASMIAADPTKVPFAYRLGAVQAPGEGGSARADVELRVTENTTGAIVGTRTLLQQYFPGSGVNSESHLLALTTALKPGTAYTMMIHAMNGHDSGDNSGLWTWTAGPVSRQFTTAGTAPNPNPNPNPTPTPDPDPNPDPTPTPSPTRAGAAIILAAALGIAAIAGKRRK